jgi:thiamine biosynthesis lipoprotein
MRQTKDIMGMPITVEVVGGNEATLSAIFGHFRAVDARFSTYKVDSEISKINRGEIKPIEYSIAMKEVFSLAEKTKRDTRGYFSIHRPDGSIDPSGIVKGWAIQNAAALALSLGYNDFFIDAGGDIQSRGVDESGLPWTIGIRNPFDRSQIVKVLRPKGSGVATSGTYIRGQHIYDPHAPGKKIDDIVSITVVGPDVFEADRFATAAFAMGKDGIHFIEQLSGFEGYQIDINGRATMTSGFQKIVA